MRISVGRQLSSSVGALLLCLGAAEVVESASGREGLSVEGFFAGLGLALVLGALLPPHPTGTRYGAGEG